jgi:hypothetical protein
MNPCEAGMTPRKNASKTRGKPFQPGNPGRPKGARHKTTLAIETLLEGEAETLTRKAIEMAKGGDITALRLCLESPLKPRASAMSPILVPTKRVVIGRLIMPLAMAETLAKEISAFAAKVRSREQDTFQDTSRVH